MSSSAPSFASFRPKPKAPVHADHPAPEETRREEKQHKKHSLAKHTAHEERSKSPPRQERERERYDSTKRAYFSDRRGDLDIVKYGTLNRYDIPSYRRCGYGNILGLPGQKIDRDYSTDTEIHVLPLVRPRQKRMLTDKHGLRHNKRALRLIQLAEDHQSDATRDFIALSNTAKRKRGSSSGSGDGRADAADVDYRGIDDEDANLDDFDEADTYYDSDVERTKANPEVAQKNSRLTRETRHDPSNLQAWLDLIEHQESMVKLDQAISDLLAADRQNLADVRISTYEEALRRIGNDDPSKIELQAGLLREAKGHWDDTKVAKRWQAVLQQHPHSVKLWFGYLDVVQSTFSSFRYDECRAVFLKAFSALRQSGSGDGTITEARLHLFVRLTSLIHQAGYQELALAIWQAVLEFNYLAPHDLAEEDKVERFEAFWESEAPRIGEPNCKGWRHTSVDEAIPPECTIVLDRSESSKSSLDDFSKYESDSISKLRYPGRSTDDVGEDDPFHTIFVSDLRDYLAMLTGVSLHLQLDAFLCFCGLPTLPSQGLVRPWRHDPYLQSRFSDSQAKTEAECDGLKYREAISQYFQSPLNKMQMTSDLLVRQTFSLHSSRLSPEFIRTTLKLLVTNTAESELVGEYLLAFESRHFPSDLPKAARQLLKDRPSSVRLYNMYGIAEGQQGNHTKAEQVFAAALNIKSTSVDRLHLLGSYVRQALNRGDRVEALRRLIKHQDSRPAAQSPSSDPAVIQTTRAALQDSLTNALLGQDYDSAVLLADHLALLVYLSGDFDTSSALKVHSDVNAWFRSHKLESSVHAEVHAQAIARLLVYHVTHTSFVKPALLRTALEPLIATFPDNTILLSTYAANEARFAIDDRVRGNMHRILDTSRSSSITTWAFAIHHETLKGEIAGSTSHSVRALYKRATAIDAPAARCPAIWQMYMQFERDQCRKERRLRPNKRPRRDGKKSKWETRVEDAGERVKETFYQGLKMLPWCKDFIMLAFTDALDVFSEEELWRLYRVMMEKELRVYTEMNEPRL